MNLSPHFTLKELTISETAQRLGIDNTPGASEVAALRRLCEKVLERVRTHYARPVIVTSGFRSVALNQRIGGSASSQHCRGEAADFTVPGISNIELCRWIERHLNYDQLIYEYGESGWVHCSYREPYRNMELSAVRDNGRTIYLPGLAA
ncbi:MAG: D-Ala-D-Ala carboxypeptidase family metallohydrolase [Parasphingorhabdus sp.]|nr:D-Ala-D-Ala carboxypeptidase family metallohydrolase [Parasphingorhabdus sp.]